jgi:hypothetical protein|tara:strand:+ start:355 stop:684 length:330 start_codon:yes stop_codon:yes gene_type:complete
MPYSKEELDNLAFYQSLITRDESKYLEMVQKRTENGNVQDGILRDKNTGNIILFERIIDGQGTDGTSYMHLERDSSANNLHELSFEDGYWIYEENDELNKIIKREFTEF